MTPDQIIRHFGGERQAADALGCTRQYINILKKRGKIPPKTQAWIQVKTKGELLADEEGMWNTPETTTLGSQSPTTSQD